MPGVVRPHRFRFLSPLVLLAVSCPKPAPSPLHFAREEVSLTVRPGCVEVFGVYHFACLAKEPFMAQLFYPFPLDSFHRYPDSIAVPGRRFERADSGISFYAKFRPGKEDSVATFYRQPLNGNRARYIVTTTRKWKRPIDAARFQVTVSVGLRNPKLNYQPDSTSRADSTITYWFTCRSFFPSEDVVVTWSGSE